MTDTLNTTFAALADPTRRAILTRLADGDATVNQLAAPFPMTVQAVSKHLKVLEQAGLISRRRAAQSRPCHLEVERLDRAAAWMIEHRQVWSDRFDRLESLLLTIRQPPKEQPS